MPGSGLENYRLLRQCASNPLRRTHLPAHRAHGPQNLPTAKQTCSGEKLRESALMGLWLRRTNFLVPQPVACPGRARLNKALHSTRPVRVSTHHPSDEDLSMGAPFTQTLGATPRKVSRILEIQGRVNEKPCLWTLWMEGDDGAPGEIRTPDLMLRRHSLYPAELRARFTRIPHFLTLADRAPAVAFPGDHPTAIHRDWPKRQNAASGAWHLFFPASSSKGAVWRKPGELAGCTSKMAGERGLNVYGNASLRAKQRPTQRLCRW